jgi:hypothetical protein
MEEESKGRTVSQVNRNKQDLNISKSKGRNKETSEYYDEYFKIK